MINFKFIIFRIKDYFVHRFKINYEQNTVFYIGGSDTFPPPLTQSEEAVVLNELGGENDIQAKSVLIERNLRLVVLHSKKIRKYRSKYRGFNINRNNWAY